MDRPHPLADRLYRGRRILVTGGAGLYGRALVPRLLTLGAEVRTASRTAPQPPLSSSEHRIGDLTDRRFAEAAMEGMEAVFHLAGRRGSIGMQTAKAATMLGENALVCLNTLAAAQRAGVKALVYVSTVTVYPPMAVYREDLAWSANPHPGDQYAAWAKRIAEKYVEALAIEHGFADVAVVRPVNTFGPFDDFDPKTALVVPALIGRAERRESPFVVWGDGSAVRDFLYVDDAVGGLLLAYERGLGRGPINLGSGTGHTIRAVAEAVLEATGHSGPIAWDPTKPSGEPSKVADTTRAREILGFRPEVPLAEAIARTVAWHRSQGRWASN
ncbi:MAG: NAD-dependent epimerase/dehydratase family protein [Alphaproteobacteria bacterium]|nr:NAD-dependent epimerase/dehydratase family protein [Alphaproteobacteria bacterium]